MPPPPHAGRAAAINFVAKFVPDTFGVSCTNLSDACLSVGSPLLCEREGPRDTEVEMNRLAPSSFPIPLASVRYGLAAGRAATLISRGLACMPFERVSDSRFAHVQPHYTFQEKYYEPNIMTPKSHLACLGPPMWD